MAVTLFNDTDLKLLAGMGQADLQRVIATKTVRAALIMRRNLQISLANYSKRHPAIGRFDNIQASVIGICKQIEIASRNAFTVTYWRKLKAKVPDMTLVERIERKEKIKRDWEKLLRTFSY